MEPENHPEMKRKIIFQTSMLGFHICFRGCNSGLGIIVICPDHFEIHYTLSKEELVTIPGTKHIPSSLSVGGIYDQFLQGKTSKNHQLNSTPPCLKDVSTSLPWARCDRERWMVIFSQFCPRSRNYHDPYTHEIHEMPSKKRICLVSKGV